MNRYVSLFDDGEVLDGVRGQKVSRARWAASSWLASGPQGRACWRATARQKHAFDVTPSWSFFIDCASGEGQERLFAELSNGGEVMMPLVGCGFNKRFARVADRFGVSWQLNFV